MKDQIDKELQLWAAKTEPSKEHLEDLSSQIHDEVVRERIRAANQEHYSNRKGYIFVVAGAAAALVLAFVCFSIPNVKTDKGGSFAAVTNISSESLQATVGLVREMNRLFDENWRWVAESASDVDMGIRPLQGGISGDARPMLVHITLVAKKTDCSSWNELWYSDVLMRSEEAVEICAGQSLDNNLALWVLPLANGVLHVDVSVSLSSPLRITSRESMVVEDGTPTELASFSKGSIRYKLYQTIKLLPADEKESV